VIRRGRASLCAAVWLLLCALPFAALPPLLALLPLRGAMAGLWLLVGVACPLMAAPVGFCAARGGVPAALAWPFAALGCLLLPLWGIRPEGAPLLIACALELVGAVAAEQGRARKGRGR
jgi:hypothetical protein